jgi:hypothetical protein
MRRHLLRIRHIVTAVFMAVLTPVAIGASVLVHPQPAFAYHVHSGRLSLFSDRPFDVEKSKRLVAEVDRRLRLASLDHSDGEHRIFVANSTWRARLLFLWNFGAGGVNYYPLTRNVFIRESDIDNDRVLHTTGPVPPPRTFAYYATHEIAHSLAGEAVGPLAYHSLPAWIREGVADYIGLAQPVDFEELIERLRASDPELDPKRSGLYLRYRLLVSYFIDHEKWSLEQLLASRMPQPEAEARMLAAFTN